MNAMTADLRIILLIALLAVLGFSPLAAAGSGSNAQIADHFSIGGYLQGSPVRFAAEHPVTGENEAWMEYRLHNRLNIRYDPTSALSFHWQMRTRMFAGDLVRDFPGYVEGFTRDNGLVDLSWTIIERDDWVLHYIPDRLYAEWDQGDWNVRAGRQRVNWGVNMITNPNDIFNIYSIYDFDYPERPGSDAIRIQRFIGFDKRIELAASTERDTENSVIALLYGFNARGYDVQLIGGYYRERLAAGAGWAGNLGGAGLKGETMGFYDIDKDDERRDANIVIAASLDYMLTNGLFAVAELLYNREGGRDPLQVTTGALSPDNPSFSRYQATMQMSYPLHPLLHGTLTLIGYPDENAVFISPAVSWSVISDLDFKVIGQFFAAGSDSAFDSAGNIVTAQLKYNF